MTIAPAAARSPGWTETLKAMLAPGLDCVGATLQAKHETAPAGLNGTGTRGRASRSEPVAQRQIPQQFPDRTTAGIDGK
jgi:hypothetical protein